MANRPSRSRPIWREPGMPHLLATTGLSFAGFAVLKAPDIPSVLVELGFLTNPKEEKLLLDDDYQRDVIKALVKGIDSYFRKAHK